MSEKSDFFNRLRRAQEKLPGMRIGQLIYNATNGADIFYWSDDKLIRTIENFVVATDQSRRSYSYYGCDAPTCNHPAHRY